MEQLQAECVRELIATEVAHNLPILSDGEYRRRQFQESFGEAVKGFDADPGSVYVPAGGLEETPTRRVESGPTSRGPAAFTADRSPSGWSWSATCRWKSTDSRVR